MRLAAAAAQLINAVDRARLFESAVPGGVGVERHGFSRVLYDASLARRLPAACSCF